jgi:hypothetical protein
MALSPPDLAFRSVESLVLGTFGFFGETGGGRGPPQVVRGAWGADRAAAAGVCLGLRFAALTKWPPSGRRCGEAQRDRQPPSPEQIDEIHEAPLPDRFPDCGGPLDETHIAQQFQVEIPRKPVLSSTR